LRSLLCGDTNGIMIAEKLLPVNACEIYEKTPESGRYGAPSGVSSSSSSCMIDTS
jgi:hypothetical protein